MASRAAGEDIPATGRSLFDILTTVQTPEGPRLRVPFPFDKLRSLVITAGGLSGKDVSETLLPIGRSLQRDAAAPDFFAFPRRVLGVTGEPANPDPAATLVMRDRLYLGYQPKSETLEVISFNEEAGRFEFQIVEDYAPGKKPRTVQARRSLCLSCHHNAGPIFSDPPWSETPANPVIAARLAKAARAPVPGPANIEANRRSVETLHRSIGEANRLPHASRLWSGACTAPNTARYCKANLLSTVLEHRLTGRRSFGQGDYMIRRESEIFLQETQRYAWPDGFEVASPFIGDIDPTAPGDDAARKTADPLADRPALGVLDVADSAANEEIIELLGDFFTDSDIRWLEKALFNLAESVGAHRRVVRIPCAFGPVSSGGSGPLIGFTCVGQVPGFPTMIGRLPSDRSGQAPVLIDKLSIELLQYRGLLATVEATPVDRSEVHGLTLRPVDPATGLQPRTGEGMVFASVELIRPTPGENGGEAIFTIVDDIKRFRTTIGTLSSFRLPGSQHPVTQGGLRRAQILRALAIRLGQPVPDWCCQPATGLPPPTTAVEPAALSIAGLSTTPGPAHPSLQAFHRVCGACHAGQAARPANFLFGSSERQIHAIAGCAPRILGRLEQWGTKAPQVPAMPPRSELAKLGQTPQQWLESSDYRRILRFTETLAVGDGVRHTANYRALPACAPAKSGN